MWNKIYLAVLAVSTLLMSFFTYYAWSWLQSIGRPILAIEGYEFHAGLAWPILWLFTILLLLLGNGVLWITGQKRLLWITFAFFSVFVGFRYFWLEGFADQFRVQNSLPGAGIVNGPILGLILIFLMAVIVFFDQFIIERARARSHKTDTDQTTFEGNDPTSEETDNSSNAQ